MRRTDAARRRLLAFLVERADDRGRVRLSTKEIARGLSEPGRIVSDHDVTKLLWLLRRQGVPLSFREDRVGRHSKSGVLRDIRIER